MEKINNICWIVVLVLTSFILGYTKGASDTEKELDGIDTTYNIITLDSIKYNIKEKDSVITKLKIKYEEEVKDANNLDDTSAIKLFKKLVTD